MGIVLLAVTLNPTITSDGLIRYSVIEGILSGGSIPTVKLSLIQVFLSLPLAFAAKLFGLAPALGVSYFNFLAFLVLSTSILVSLQRIYSTRVAIITLLILLSSSVLPHHLQLYFGEVFSAFTICAGLLISSNRYIWATLLVGLGIANTPALLPAAVIGALILLKKRPTLLLAVFLATTLIFFENYFKYGSLSHSPYLLSQEKGIQTLLPYSGKSGFSYPIFFGALSILLSFGKGIIFYIPNLLIFSNNALIKKMHLANIYGVALIFSAATGILVYSKWWAWYGGDFWGPRFFLILAIPAAIAAAVEINSIKNISGSRAFFILGLLVVATWVGIDGVIFGQFHMELCTSNNFQYEMLCWYTPEFSALWRPFVVLNWQELMSQVIYSQRFMFALWQALIFIYLIFLTAISLREINKNE